MVGKQQQSAGKQQSKAAQVCRVETTMVDARCCLTPSSLSGLERLPAGRESQQIVSLQDLEIFLSDDL
jgi:hypothetical protein